jgi:hypothetical protein
MGNRTPVKRVAVGGGSLAGLWAAYSFYTTAGDLPKDAKELARMLADPQSICLGCFWQASLRC